MSETRRRLDKWLWYARLTKSRTLAAKLVRDGYVRLNGQRATDPARQIASGDVLTVAAPHRTAILKVVSAGERRGPTGEARTLYEDLTAASDPDQTRGEPPLVTGEPDH